MTVTGISIGFYICALVNLSVLIAPFKNDDSWPSLLGREGVGGIVLWGFAYASVARSYAETPLTVLVFAVEKMYYFAAWVALQKAIAYNTSVARQATDDGNVNEEESPRFLYWFQIAKPEKVELAGRGAWSLFGLVDLACGIFFFVVAFQNM
jgi:hypothetical protein